MIKKILVGGIIGIFFLLLIAMRIVQIIRMGWLLILFPLLGAVLGVIVVLLVLWILWR